MISYEYPDGVTCVLREMNRVDRVASMDIVDDWNLLKPDTEDLRRLSRELFARAEAVLLGMVHHITTPDGEIVGDDARRYAQDAGWFYTEGVGILDEITFRIARKDARRNGDLGFPNETSRPAASGEGVSSTQVLDA